MAADHYAIYRYICFGWLNVYYQKMSMSAGMVQTALSSIYSVTPAHRTPPTAHRTLHTARCMQVGGQFFFMNSLFMSGFLATGAARPLKALCNYVPSLLCATTALRHHCSAPSLLCSITAERHHCFRVVIILYTASVPCLYVRCRLDSTAQTTLHPLLVTC